MSSKVAIWMTNYNNAKHIRKAIESVLKQDYTDYVLLVFDNHSTDGAAEIIQRFAQDNPGRVVNVPIPKGLAGIPLMAFAWEYLNKLDFDYSITLGGHDSWPNERHLSTLVQHLDVQIQNGGTPALVYTDTWQENEEDKIVGRFGNIMQQGGQTGRPFIPQWVISGVDSPQLFGLWNEAVRKKVPIRHLCAGWDHLVVMHAALYGSILYEPRTALLMRAPPPGDGLDKYGLRHFSPAARKQGSRDFLQQLEWVTHCVEQATTGNQFYDAMLTASMFATYVCLRGYNLAIFEGATEQFNANPDVQKAASALVAAASAIKDLVRPVTP